LLHAGTLGSIYHKSPETFIRTSRGKQLPESPALNAGSLAALIRLPDSSTYQPPTSIEYRPTGGVTTDIGADSGGGAAGDDADPPDQEESLLGGGGEVDDTQGQEFSPISPVHNGASAARGGPPASGGPLAQLQSQIPHDPYANLDGLFMTDAPQPLSAPNIGRGLGGQHDDLIF